MVAPWKIEIEGFAWTDVDVTAAHLVALADLLGDSWAILDPWTGPRLLAGWLTVLLAGSIGDIDAALAFVYGLKSAELIATLSDRLEPDG